MAKHINAGEIVRRLQSGEEVNIIDVRERLEVLTGKIRGAKHIPLGLLALRKNELEKDKTYIVTCQSGNRSKAACGLLEALGFKAENMVGGMNSWSGEIE